MDTVMRLFTSAVMATAMVTASAVHAEVKPVPSLDQARYLGRWHEIARLPMFFQRKCASDVTATYSLNPDGTIRVHNACKKSDGSEISADGVARQPDPKIASKLEVRFAPSWLSWIPMVWADYWVIALDPDYRWAMVGQPGKKYLWILSREPRLDRATFEMLKTKATGMGYDLSPLLVSGKVD